MKKDYKIKKCLICNKEFKPNSGFQKFCSQNCFKIYEKSYQKMHYKKYQSINKNKLAKYSKEYRTKNKDILKLKKLEYYLKNKEKILLKLKKYRDLHKKQLKEYKILHKKERREYDRIYTKNRLKTDINFRIAHYLRTRIRKVLRYNKKTDSTMKLLGCSIDFLKQHLEKQFTEGMSFSNYGKWHIDHIKPCARFDLSKPIEQLKCFHYTNLQPLWESDNCSKKDKILV
jgi:hypothetical protein